MTTAQPQYSLNCKSLRSFGLKASLVVAAIFSHALASAASSAQVPMKYSEPPDAPSAAQRQRALQLQGTVTAAVLEILNSEPSRRCETLRAKFVVERLAAACRTDTAPASLALKHILLSVDDSDESGLPDGVTYTFQLFYENKFTPRGRVLVATVFLKQPGFSLRIDNPAAIPTLRNELDK